LLLLLDCPFYQHLEALDDALLLLDRQLILLDKRLQVAILLLSKSDVICKFLIVFFEPGEESVHVL